jgi:hypothetical protein
MVTSTSIVHISTNPKLSKKCKENVNLIYHVYIITCKKDGKIYVCQSLNPQKRFKPDVFNPPKQVIVDVNIYKPFVNYFGFTIFFLFKKIIYLIIKKRVDFKSINYSNIT